MARGRLLRTKKREAYFLAKRAEAGRLQAQREFNKKKPLTESFREHLGKFLDRMSMNDVLKLGSVISLTLILKPMIQKLPEFQTFLVEVPPTSIIIGLKKGLEEGNLFTIKNPFTGEVLWEWTTSTPTAFRPPGTRLKGDEPEPAARAEPKKIVQSSESIAWITAFLIATLIVTFGPELLQTMGGVKGLATLLFSIA